MPTNQELRSVWDQIAPAWYNFRHYTLFKPELQALAREWRHGKLLNAGCGHGADFLPFRDGFELYGVDFSLEMLKLAERYARKFNFTVRLTRADVTALPYPDASFDWAIAVASYHHLERPQQLPALEELRRVLKPGGEAFITVWNRRQPKFWLRGKEIYVPFRVSGRIWQRYYYLFTYGEAERLVKQAGFTIISSRPESFYRFPVKLFSRNICLRVKKPAG